MVLDAAATKPCQSSMTGRARVRSLKTPVHGIWRPHHTEDLPRFVAYKGLSRKQTFAYSGKIRVRHKRGEWRDSFYFSPLSR